MELTDHPLLSRLLPEDLEVLQALSTERTLEPAEAIYREGEVANALYILLEGMARLSCTRPDGAQQRLGALQPGAVLGVSGLGTGTRPATAAAMGPATVLEVPQRLLGGPPRTPEGRLAMALREVVALAQNNQLRAANATLVRLANLRVSSDPEEWSEPETNGGWISPPSPDPSE